MTLRELKSLALFQLGLDGEDTEDYQPHLARYLNEGYETLVQAAGGKWEEGLRRDGDSPDLPEWTHRALADWASYRLCLCGGAARQNRGLPFRQAFEGVRRRLAGGESSRFINWR